MSLELKGCHEFRASLRNPVVREQGHLTLKERAFLAGGAGPGWATEVAGEVDQLPRCEDSARGTLREVHSGGVRGGSTRHLPRDQP